MHRIYSLSSFNLDNFKNFIEDCKDLYIFDERKSNFVRNFFTWENLVNDFYKIANLYIIGGKLFGFSSDYKYVKLIKDLMFAYEYDELATLPANELKTYANNLDWYYKIGFPTDMNNENFDYYLEKFLKEAEQRNFHYLF